MKLPLRLSLTPPPENAGPASHTFVFIYFSYIIFLRITPFLPNWFINLVSPVIGVRLTPFWIGTFVGVAPPSFVAIQAGTTLQQLTSSTDAITVWSVVILAGFAILRWVLYHFIFMANSDKTRYICIRKSLPSHVLIFCPFHFSIVPVLFRRRLKNKFD